MLVAVGVSVLTEVSQLFSRGRYPSTTDLVLNASGAAIGMILALAVQQVVRRPSSSARSIPGPRISRFVKDANVEKF